jgi:hypothetical protein
MAEESNIAIGQQPPIIVEPAHSIGELLADAMSKLRLVIALVGMFYTAVAVLTIFGALCLLLPDLFFVLGKSGNFLLNLAQIIMSLIALALGVCAIVVICYQRRITASLATAEVQVDTIRDIALIQLQSGRYSLEQLTEKLHFHPENNVSPSDYVNVIQNIRPLISLLIGKERNVVNLGMAGLKFYQALKKILKK